jgi:phosphoglycolate phosphatase
MKCTDVKMNVIFDLDGTLIDSAPTILKGLEKVVEVSGREPVVPLTASLIGPPLRDTISMLMGDNVDLDRLVLEFKKYYDNDAYKASHVYEGIDQMLQTLHQRGFSLFLATNKRFDPTMKIVQHFGWDKLFKSIYALDKFPDFHLGTKANMLSHLQNEHQINPDKSLYIGDRYEDYLAAKANLISTILVSWGYGDFEDKAEISKIKMVASSDELLKAILSFQ